MAKILCIGGINHLREIEEPSQRHLYFPVNRTRTDLFQSTKNPEPLGVRKEIYVKHHFQYPIPGARAVLTYDAAEGRRVMAPPMRRKVYMVEESFPIDEAEEFMKRWLSQEHSISDTNFYAREVVNTLDCMTRLFRSTLPLLRWLRFVPFLSTRAANAVREFEFYTSGR